MATFSLGDRVFVSNTYYDISSGPKVGVEGTVVDMAGFNYWVHWDKEVWARGYSHGCHDNVWAVDESSLSLVTPLSTLERICNKVIMLEQRHKKYCSKMRG